MGSYMLFATDELQTVQQYPKLHNAWFLVRCSLTLLKGLRQLTVGCTDTSHVDKAVNAASASA